MMYPFIVLDEETEITHSELRSDGTVKVYIEKADEMFKFRTIVKDNTHLIMEFAGKGGK